MYALFLLVNKSPVKSVHKKYQEKILRNFRIDAGAATLLEQNISQESAAYCGFIIYTLVASWLFENFYQAALDEECGEDA